MPLSAGHRIGPYEIVSPLGAGGMGEVYRATDTNLGRQVALKVLPPNFANDAERMARFKREAQVLASLNHPNIATIHGIEGNAIVMELVEGKDLAGPMTVADALPIARQIIEALEAAHEKGIVHRDLKPANIKITPQGVVKVLDFGLAKATENPAHSDPSKSPTLSIAGTQAGVIMGTAGYMSPEQASGRTVDRRADIWSFGVVLWEMLSGRKLFEGETIMHTLADVVRGEIDLNKLPAEIPQAIRGLIGRCLERDLKRRLQWIGEARIAIEDYSAGGTEGTGRLKPATTRTQWLPWALFAATALAAGAGWYIATRPAPLRPLVQLNVELDPDASVQANAGSPPAISPDGSRIVVVLRGSDGKSLLYTRLLQQSKLVPLSGTENPNYPFFSPDGQWIGFAADGKLKKISADGGATVTICDAANIRGASWGDDGNIFLATGGNSSLSRVSAAGGTPAPATKLSDGERTHRWPQVLPGSQTVLYTANSGSIGDYENATIDALSVKSGQRKTLVRGGFNGRYLPTGNRKGHLVYLHRSTLFAAPFDPEGLALTGPVVPALENVNSVTFGGGRFAFSATGIFLFQAGGGSQSELKIYLADRSGAKMPLLPQAGAYSTPRFSPDGKRLAFSFSNGAGSDIWVKDMDRDAPSKLSFLKGTNDRPVWTPDGRNIVFRSAGQDQSGLYWMRADGAGEAQRLMDGKLTPLPESFSPDGKRLSYSANGNNASYDLFTAQLEGDPGNPKLGKPELILGTPYREYGSSFSPDGRWLAYQSDETGPFQAYVRPFPGPGGRWQISSDGGVFPFWSKDGRELFFQGLDGSLMVAGYTAGGDSFNPGKPRAWPDLTPNAIFTGTFHVAPDGKHAAVILPDGAEKQKPITHLTLLLNFFDELQRKAPVGGK